MSAIALSHDQVADLSRVGPDSEHAKRADSARILGHKPDPALLPDNLFDPRKHIHHAVIGPCVPTGGVERASIRQKDGANGDWQRLCGRFHECLCMGAQPVEA